MVFLLGLLVAATGAFRTAGAFFAISAAALTSASTTANFLVIIGHIFIILKIII
jgi:hypothetical protein